MGNIEIPRREAQPRFRKKEGLIGGSRSGKASLSARQAAEPHPAGATLLGKGKKPRLRKPQAADLNGGGPRYADCRHSMPISAPAALLAVITCANV